jgi:ribosome-binding protein aMBF1 (putative translation factor)
MEPSVVSSERSATLRASLAAARVEPAELAGSQVDPAVEAVAHALRGARARTGMSEQQVVAKLAEDGFAITVTRLRGWERTGVIRIDAAAHLADAYGVTLDTLAGRRAFRSFPARA